MASVVTGIGGRLASSQARVTKYSASCGMSVLRSRSGGS